MRFTELKITRAGSPVYTVVAPVWRLEEIIEEYHILGWSVWR